MTTDTLEFPDIVDPEQAAQSGPVEIADEVIDIAELKDGAALVKYSRTELALADLRQRYEGATFDLTTTKGDKAARAARLELVTLRTSLEKKRKELKAPALDIGKKIDSEAARLTAEIEKLEQPIDAQIKADEKRREEEAKIKAQGEAFRKALHLALIDRVRCYVAAAEGLPSDRIEKGIVHVESLAFGAETQEFLTQYEAAKQDALAGLRRLQSAAKEREAIEAQRLENERIAAEQAEAQRKLDEQAAALKRQADELAAAQLAQQVARTHAAVFEFPAPEPARENVIVQNDAGGRWSVDAELAPTIQQALTPEASKPPIPAVAEVEKLLDSPAAAHATPSHGPVINTGELCKRLGFIVTAEFIVSLGVQKAPAPEGKKVGSFFYESAFPWICELIQAHLQDLIDASQAAKAA